jgi:hypothetical protein
MEFIATYWWAWLAITVICTAYCWFNQVRRVKGMFGSVTKAINDPGRMSPGDLIDAPFKSFFAGLAPMIAAGIAASASGILLVIAVILHIIRYANGG